MPPVHPVGCFRLLLLLGDDPRRFGASLITLSRFFKAPSLQFVLIADDFFLNTNLIFRQLFLIYLLEIMQLVDDLFESEHYIAQLYAIRIEVLQIGRRLLESVVTIVPVNASLRF